MMMRSADGWLVGLMMLLPAWLGAALLTAGSVAPAAFAVLPSRMLAGALVGRVLPALFIAGAIVGAVTLAHTLTMRPRPTSLSIASGLLMMSCAVAQLAIQPRIHRVRESISGPLELLESSDPRRMQFGRLHTMSLASLGLAVVGAAVACWLCARLVSRTVGQ